MKGIFKKGIVIRKCEECGRDIDVTKNENRKLCYSCQLMENRRKNPKKQNILEKRKPSSPLL